MSKKRQSLWNVAVSDYLKGTGRLIPKKGTKGYSDLMKHYAKLKKRCEIDKGDNMLGGMSDEEEYMDVDDEDFMGGRKKRTTKKRSKKVTHFEGITLFPPKSSALYKRILEDLKAYQTKKRRAKKKKELCDV